MNVYDSLADDERAAIETALDLFRDECVFLGVILANDDRAALAAEALAVYFTQSKGG